MLLDDFDKLGDEEFIDVGAKGACDLLRIANWTTPELSLGIESGPFGMMFEGYAVEYTGIVDVERDAGLACGFAPYLEGIFGDAGCGPSDFGGIAGVTHVPLAIVLNKIGFNTFEDVLYVREGDVFTEFFVFGGGVQIEMEAKEGVGSLHSWRVSIWLFLHGVHPRIDLNSRLIILSRAKLEVVINANPQYCKREARR